MANDDVLYLRFLTLKSQIKDEFSRRKYVGAIDTYANKVEYPNGEAPAENKVITNEDYNHLAANMQIINKTGISGFKDGDYVTEPITLEAKLTTFKAKEVTSSSTDCSGSCTGMCYSTCSTSCSTGCGGTCSGSCSTECTGCTAGCSGCGNTCSEDRKSVV